MSAQLSTWITWKIPEIEWSIIHTSAQTNRNVCTLSSVRDHTANTRLWSLADILKASHTSTHAHTRMHALPQGEVEEISRDPSSSPLSFHFLYLPDGKQLTAITSPSARIHAHTLIFISLPLALTNTQTLSLILIVSLSIKYHSWCGGDLLTICRLSSSQKGVFSSEGQIGEVYPRSSLFYMMQQLYLSLHKCAVCSSSSIILFI